MKVCPSCGLQYGDDQLRCFVDSATLQSMADPNLGQTLAGRYLIEAVLGEGGMATVYRARHTLVDRPVAVKILAPSMARNESLRERFRREAKNAAALAHPNVIEIYDHGQTPEGSLFMVMELLEGAPLADHIAQGPIDPGRVVSLGLQMARGLARAHDFEVIHRDLKPENVFVVHAGPGREVVKLLDFGIARSMHDSRLTNAGEIFGTPQYMAPERITTIDAGPAADLYALGVILFEMLAGRLPFESEEITGLFIKHLQESPPKLSALVPQCPRRLEALIGQLLAKKPEDRPVDAHQVIKELQALLPRVGSEPSGGHPVATTPSRPIAAPTLPPTTLERWARRAAIFEEMLAQAFPGGQVPSESRTLLDRIRTTLRRIEELRAEGLKEQRRLEELEAEARENRARLGFAVQSLAEDLSLAREAVRNAHREVAPYFDAEEQAKAAYIEADRRLQGLGGYHALDAPDEAWARALRDVADAVDRWTLGRSAADKARRWLEGKTHEVDDLGFQVQALRDQLARAERSYAQQRETSERSLAASGEEVQKHERQLMTMAGAFCESLRSRRELSELFQRLEQEG